MGSTVRLVFIGVLLLLVPLGCDRSELAECQKQTAAQQKKIIELEEQIASLTQDPKAVYAAAVASGRAEKLVAFIEAFPQETELALSAQKVLKQMAAQQRDKEEALERVEKRKRTAAEAQRKAERDRKRAEAARAAQAEKTRGTAAGNGFYFRNVSFKRPTFGMTPIIGEMANHSGRDVQFATFTLSVYSPDGRLVATSPVIMQSFQSGSVKSFDTMVDTALKGDFTYKLAFENAF